MMSVVGDSRILEIVNGNQMIYSHFTEFLFVKGHLELAQKLIDRYKFIANQKFAHLYVDTPELLLFKVRNNIEHGIVSFIMSPALIDTIVQKYPNLGVNRHLVIYAPTPEYAEKLSPGDKSNRLIFSGIGPDIHKYLLAHPKGTKLGDYRRIKLSRHVEEILIQIKSISIIDLLITTFPQRCKEILTKTRNDRAYLPAKFRKYIVGKYGYMPEPGSLLLYK